MTTPLGLHITNSVNSRIMDSNLAPAVRMPLYNADGSRNTNCWIKPFNPTCIIRGLGTLIAPSVVLTNEHYRYEQGAVANAVALDGTIYTRQVLASKNVGLGNAVDGYKTDLAVSRLDSPLPSDIQPALFMPWDYANYLPNIAVNGLPAVQIDAEQKALIARWYLISTYFNWFDKPTDKPWVPFYEPIIAGDSSHGSFVPILQGSTVRLVLVETHTSAHGGPDVARNIAAIQSAILALGLSETISTADLSAFNVGASTVIPPTPTTPILPNPGPGHDPRPAGSPNPLP